jgi:hypothetical protein
MRRGLIVKLLIAGLALLLGYAWLDGGREPIHEISRPVALPGAAR